MICCYVKNICNKKIVIIGTVPPPLGGVSVHIQRAQALLKQQNNSVTVIDVVKDGRRLGLWYYMHVFLKLLLCMPDIVFYHSLSWRRTPIEFAAIVLAKLCCGFSLRIVEHSDRFYDKKTMVYKKTINVLMRVVDQQVLMGENMLDSYRRNSIRFVKNYVVDCPYIQPDLSREIIIYNQYPTDLQHFIEMKNPLLIVNASKITLWESKDVFGLDLCILLVDDLKKLYPHLGLILAIGPVEATEYYAWIEKEAKRLDQHVFILRQCEYEIWPLFRKATIFLRPSRYDTFGISVAEALAVGTCAIASDVCARPPKTVVFKTENYNDFYMKVHECLAEHINHESVNHKCDYSNAQSAR